MTDQLDLLHLDRALTPTERRNLAIKTRSKKHGHAAPSGTGPQGETCGSCKNLARETARGGRTFLKCALMRAVWTYSYGTDVRARDAACRKWERADG
jgi:hypothetical protein